MSEPTLVEWLSARLDEDEQVARAAGADDPLGGMWVVDDLHGDADWHLDMISGDYPAEAAHIARWDPARVLAEVESKRKIIAEIVPKVDSYDDQITSEWGGSNDETAQQLLALLALPYADRPGFREEWKP